MIPYLSFVTGTYNRINYLKQMAESVRASLGKGVSYEIVLVDGGSTDGTIDWCKTQADIVLIEQGELKGAISAFNAGCQAARGEYVVIGNDDIILLDETLMCAIAFMQDNPTVGVGCFYQDRRPLGPWHVEAMPGIVRGRQASISYGQVCIIPKWLGDRVGWWGNTGAKTYGGDNELSCNVYELGYKVQPCCEWRRGLGVPWAAIRDLKADDGLRQINTKGNQDGNIWGRKWMRTLNGRRMTGPIVRETPAMPNPIQRRTRFLYLPIYEPGHGIQKDQKRGLREALARYGLVVEIDYMGMANKLGSEHMRNYVMDVGDVWQPDVFLFQIHTPDGKYFLPQHIQQMQDEYPRARFVNWNGDYHPRDLFSAANMSLAKAFDLQCVVTTRVAPHYSRAGIDWKYWQIGWEDNDGLDRSIESWDIVFLANGYSPQRQALGRMLKRLPYRCGIYGSWPNGIADGYNLYNFDDGARLYRASKISIGDDQWQAPGFVSNRLFQAMHAGGAMLLHQKVPALEELLGLVDGVHYMTWEGFADLQAKIEFWLRPENDDARQKIANNGRQFMIERHSFDSRVQELMGWL